MKFDFVCPKCGAPPHRHGRGGSKTCIQTTRDDCEGLICECDPIGHPASEQEDHGTTLENPCIEANCYHCGWGGTVPQTPKGLQAWEKKALAAGWTMPAARAKEVASFQKKARRK